VAAMLALRLLSAVLERGKWKYFGYYCILVAGVVFVVHFSMP
jgi:undecaprenyl pyrophosphate phosphatase UppP